MIKRIKGNGITLNMMKTTQFKSTRIHISFGNELNESNVTKRALLPYLLHAVTTKYNTRTKLSEYLDNLYSAQFSVGTSKLGLSHFITFDFSVISDKYTIDNESLFEEGLIFLNEVLFNPLFLEDIFVDEKRLLEEYFLSMYANKMRYTIKELIDIMFKDEPYRLSPLGSIDDLATITLQDVKEEYSKMISEDTINISIVGNFEFAEVEDLITKHLPFTKRASNLVLLENITKEITAPTRHTITQEVTQAKLALGYRLGVRYLDDDYYAALVFNSLLGGSADSLLHNKIREELGLVYFISSSYDIFKGALFIYSGINEIEYDNTVAEINIILDEIKTGVINNEAFDIAKKSLINGLIETYDSNYNLAIKIERQNLYNRDITLEQSILQINNVTKEDITKVANQLVFDTSVLLKGEQK